MYELSVSVAKIEFPEHRNSEIPKRKIPKRSESSSTSAENYVFKSTEEYFKKMYYEIFDQFETSLHDRFDIDFAQFFK